LGAHIVAYLPNIQSRLCHARELGYSAPSALKKFGERMMRNRIWAAFAISAVCATAAVAQPANISGAWTASFDSQVGEQKYTYTIKVDGGALTGHAKSNLGEGDIKGTVTGNAVTFVETLNYQDMVLSITYTGQIVSADEIKFKRDVGGQGGEDFTAKRQK
jgi:hypothetical protein